MIMFLTQIMHDFNFTINVKMDEVLHALEFKKTRSRSLLRILKTKITFHSNQGRNIYLLYNRSLIFSQKNYMLVVENVIEFTWKKNSKTITYRYLKHSTDELARYWLLHTFLPLYYTLENIYHMLHMGAVEINGKACLFAAHSFGGKSTLTHYFLQRGHKLLSDDKLALFKHNNDYNAAPSYPYIRNYRNFEDLGKYTESFSTRSLPVGYVYRLVQVGSEENISIQKVKGSDKFSIIEMSSDIKLSMLKQEKFIQLHDLAQKLSIYEISVPQSLDRIEEVYDKIVEHFDTICDDI